LPLKPGGAADQARMFTARHPQFMVDVGHNLPLEAPDAFAEAVLLVRR
jgi:pimeloyl-ACP methyl ester carboxylesterase